LFEDMSHDDGCKLNMADFLQPKIEAEIAFFLKSDLSGGSVTEGDVLDATDYVVASFEIVDSRIRDWKLKLPDTIADNASAGCYVLGKRLFAAGSVDLASVKMQLLRNGHPAGEGFGGDVMGSPYRTVAWLSNKLWEYGVELRKGELILSGALSAASAVSKGDMFEARFSDLGRITVEFV
ncbi:MAG: fumarylacetoacetate hydrolase family protein, partial [Synergistaceae bacterium]|nr:fumarylacetoacetate hydrolase family protein [Synergistaceae bacterium]